METILTDGGGAQGGAAPADLIKDTTTQTFAADVLDASMQTPVIVDFWAPWCGPCKQLTPLLEKVVTNARGAVKLVKMNIDDHPEVAQQLRVQSIPAVFAFKNGQPVDGFMGALPESQLKSFVERLVGEIGPSPVEELVAAAKAAFDEGDVATAAQAFSQVLQEEQGNAAALGGLAKCYLANNDLERAKQVLAMAPAEIRSDAEIAAAEAAIALAEKSADVGDLEPLRRRLDHDANDHEARFELALALNAAGDREDAVMHLVEIVKRNRQWNDEAARKQLLEFFEAYGPTDEVTVSGRRQLSAVLFS